VVIRTLRIVVLLLPILGSTRNASTETEPCVAPANPYGDAKFYYRLGQSCANAGQSAKAVEAFEQARRLDPHNPEILAASVQGYLRVARLPDALGVLADLVPIKSATIAPLMVRESEQDGAPIEIADAAHFYRQRVSEAKSRKDLRSEARADYLLAGALQDLDQYDEALSFYEDALRYYLKSGDHLHAARAYMGIGEVCQLAGELDQAERSFRDASEEARAAGDENAQLRVRAFLASISSDREDPYEEVEQRLNEATNTLESILAHENLNKEHRWPLTPDGVVALQLMGEVAALQDHPGLAIPLLKVALSLDRLAADKERAFLADEAEDFRRLGLAYMQAQRLEEAGSMLEEAKKVDLQLHDPEDYFLLNQMGNVRARQGRLEEAFNLFAQATDMLERIGLKQRVGGVQVSVREQTVWFYMDVVSTLLKLAASTHDAAYRDKAFQYLEKGKAQTLLTLLSETGTTDQRRLEEIKQTLSAQGPANHGANVGESLAVIEEQRDAGTIIPTSSPSEGTSSSTVASITDAQSILDDRTALLEYAFGEGVFGEGVAALWVVTRQGAQLHELGSQKEISELISRYRRTLESPLITQEEIKQHVEQGKTLFGILLAPAIKDIGANHRLIIIPAGTLYYLPFEALIEPTARLPREGKVDLSSLPYVGKQYALSYAPSVSVLRFLDNKRRANIAQFGERQLPLLAFGDPVYSSSPAPQNLAFNVRGTYEKMSGGFNPLPFSADEVKRVAAIYGIAPDSESINLRDRASKRRLRSMDLTRYRVVHFATHAIVGDAVARLTQPALVLSATDLRKPEDQFLTMSEIFDLKLDADLVVLSACKTAQGKLYRGEGLVGLTSAFLYAGSRSVVASLWPVNDQSTSLFMEAFHKNLKAGVPAAEALRAARSDVMQTTVRSAVLGEQQSLAAPYFWAPFILVGDSQ